MRLLKVSVAAFAVVLVVSLCIAADQAKLPTNAAIGQAAPAFALQDQNGKTINLSDYSGKIVVLEWTNPQCPFVIRHYDAQTMTTLAGKYAPQGVVWLAINSTDGITNDADKQWVADRHLQYPVLNDASGRIGHAYGATNTPNMYIIGKDGKLLYSGAIDNDRDGDLKTGKVNYVDQALSEILADKTVSVPETKPYGCNVHYAK